MAKKPREVNDSTFETAARALNKKSSTDMEALSNVDDVFQEVLKEALQTRVKQLDNIYRGMHNGTVRGKFFEQSRRSRKSHAARKAQHAGLNK